MKHIFIIDAGQAYFHSKGELNHLLTEVAADKLKELGHEVRITRIQDGYDIPTEINHYLWADIVIYQQPGWWMGSPWSLKKYLDEVLTQGHGALYSSDGRTRSDASKGYGSGGLLHKKQYMISATWNAPVSAFTEDNEFFEGRGIDAVYFPFHKMNQFLGMTPLPTFSCHDVIKAPQINQDLDRYREHLAKHI